MQLVPAWGDLRDAHVIGCAEGEIEAKHWLDANAYKCRLAVVDLFSSEGSRIGEIATMRRLTSQRNLKNFNILYIAQR